MKFINIIVFGDSLAYGVTDTEFGGWVNRLRIYLDNHEEKEINVFNLSIPGEITEETLSRFKAECNVRYDKDKKTIIVFAIGINDTQDINGNYRISIEQFIRNIKALIHEAKKFTNNILFVGLSKVDESKVVPVFWNKNKSYFNDKILKFDNSLETICNKEKALYLKVYDMITLNDLSDGLHLNNIGHQKLCDVVLNKIIAIFNNY
jgi:lysophospholipase L1-like esterase